MSDAVPGDSGAVEVVHAGPNGVWTRWAEAPRASSERVVAECAARERCGGCPWMSASLTTQREARWSAFLERMAPADLSDAAGVVGPAVLPWQPTPLRVGFRTRLMPMVGWHKDGNPGLGLFAPRSRDVVAVERCPVEEEALGGLLRAVLARWHQGAPTGSLQRAGLRALRIVGNPPARPDALLTAVFRQPDEDALRAGAALVGLTHEGRHGARSARIAGVHAVINPREAGNLLAPPEAGGELRHLAGDPAVTLRWRYADSSTLTLSVGPTAFVQTRHDAAEAMLTTASGWLREALTEHGPAPRTLVDLHAGAGFFGLALARWVDRVVLVERHGPALREVHAAAEANGIDPEQVEALPMSTAEALAARPELVSEASAVIVDPPRAGLDEATRDALGRLAAGAVLVYASCNPASLARDVEALRRAGLRLEALAPIDMFPHTPHFEVMARLRRG